MRPPSAGVRAESSHGAAAEIIHWIVRPAMSRLLIRNSSLVYPPVPADILRKGDVVLPLPEYLEDAMFLPSPYYSHYYDSMPRVYRRCEAVARQTAELLPEVLTSIPRGGASAWEGFIGSFIKFTIGPLLVTQEVVREACAQADFDSILAWDDPGRVSWWGGRQLVEDAARAASALGGAPVEVRSSAAMRTARDACLPMMARAQAARYFIRQIRPTRGDRPEPHDIIIATLGHSMRRLVARIGAGLAERGLRVLTVEMPFNPLDPGWIDAPLPRATLYSLRDVQLLRRVMEAVDESFDWQDYFEDRLSRTGDFPLSGSLRSALMRRMCNVLAYDMPFALYHRELWRRMLDAVRPRAVLAFNHYGTALAPGILQARDHGIGTVLCQHGMGSPHWRSTTLLPFDLSLTFGEFSRELLKSVADDVTRFAITGHSGWDALRAAPTLERPQPEEVPIVLATTQTVEQRMRAAEPSWWLRKLGLACRELGARLVVKPHPNEEDTSDYETLARELPDAIQFVAHGERPLEELIEECTVLATRFSTTAVQAIIAGKMVMTVCPVGGRERYPFAEEGAAVKVNSCEEILPALRALLTSADLHRRLTAGRERFIARHVGPLDGGATDRIVEHILQVAEHSAPDYD